MKASIVLLGEATATPSDVFARFIRRQCQAKHPRVGLFRLSCARFEVPVDRAAGVAALLAEHLCGPQGAA